MIYFNTNSSSDTEAGKNCHRTKFVWDGNGGNFSRALVRNAMRWMGNRWFLLTHDYDWGHATSAGTRKLVEDGGGLVVEELLIPVGTRDFSQYIEGIRKRKVNVVAAAVGGDDMKALQAQVQEAGQDTNPAWLNNQQDWPDVWLRNGKGLFGKFGTTWYHRFELPGVTEFVERYRREYSDAPLPTPGNVFYNGYMATRALLQTIQKIGTTQNHAVIRELERLRVSAKERMQHDDGYMNSSNHHFQQTVYMATANHTPVDANDLYKIVSRVDPQAVGETDDQTACVLESFSQTPITEP